MNVCTRAITVASAMLMPFSAVATPDFMKQNIGSLDCGINEIAKFNGSAWECSSDLDALAQAIEEVGDLGCSATQQDNSVLITCGDGTAGVIAGAGTVVIYPEGQIGQVPPIDYNTGPIVAVDGSGVVLGKLLDLSEEEQHFYIELDAGEFGQRRGKLLNAPSTQEVIFSGEGSIIAFLVDDCSGAAFVLQGNDVVVEINNRLFISDLSLVPTLLIKSYYTEGYWRISDGEPLYVESSECENKSFVYGVHPLVEYILAPEVVNAVYPVRAEQLP